MNPNPAHVYVMEDANGATKVGLSKFTDARVRNVSLDRRAKVALVWATPLRYDAKIVEGTAHNMLLEHRIKGEWFSVDAEQAIEAVTKSIQLIEGGHVPERSPLPDGGARTLPGRFQEPDVRKVVALPESTWALIEDFRYSERIPSEAEAIRRLLLQALAKVKRKAK